MARAKRTNAARLWAVNRRFGSWRCHGSGDANVVWTSLTTNNVSQFLSTAVSGCGKGLNDALEEAEAEQLTEEETKIPGDLLTQMLNNRAKGIFLFEGRALREGNYHGTKHIILRCYRRPCTPGDGSHLFELKLPISVSPVEDMFRWVDERWVCGDTNGIPSRVVVPWNNPDSECDGRHFIFVHGYDVNAQSARGWAAEMFKRLWQAGSRSKFTAVDWYGNDSQIEWPIPKLRGESPNYYVNVEHAFATAPYFAQMCEQLNGSKVILAHSLGNILASSAAKDCNLQYQKYYMLNAAVPMEAYDMTAYTNTMVDADWRILTNRVYAANWWKLFNPADGRQMLSWRGRFAGITNAVNCHSPGEDTLGNISNNYGVVASMWKKNFWAAQELNKGTKKQLTLSHWLGNNEGGWGFNPSFGARYVSMGTPKPSLRKRILSMDDDELVRNPVFHPFDDTWLHTAGVLSSNAVQTVRARILADAIPALSFAAGANEFKPGVVSGNINYMDYLDNGYPDGMKTKRWRHSDLKKFAYFYVKGFYDEVTKREERNQNP